ncbi:hypothetical protein XACG115_1930010 [Xanthomonas citri pv. citri]|nr:hypothetical protein XACG115_1930010 [Xanthomonas citri pv. citri]
MIKIKSSSRYRVDTKSIRNASPPPRHIKKYVVFDRQANVELKAEFASLEEAEKHCEMLNKLSPSPS